MKNKLQRLGKIRKNQPCDLLPNPFFRLHLVGGEFAMGEMIETSVRGGLRYRQGRQVDECGVVRL